LLTNTFECSVLDALERMSTLAGDSLGCVLATPIIGDAGGEEVIAGIRDVWAALHGVLRPASAALLVFDDRQVSGRLEAGLAWRIAFALQSDHWILRNALVGPVSAGAPSCGIGFFFVRQADYHFDVDAVRAKYGANPGDVVLARGDSITDRFVAAACPGGGPVTELFVGGACREVAA